jgi:ankyrin repeat protein
MMTLLEAIKNSDLAAVSHCLVGGTFCGELDEQGKSPLVEAANRDEREMVGMLLRHGAEVNQRDGGGQTALQGAAFRGYPEMVKLLLASGADRDALGQLGSTALYWACCGGGLEVVRFLVEAGCDMEKANENGVTPLGRAASACYSPRALEIAQYLIAKGANVDHVDNAGRTALMNSALGGNLEIAQCLLEAGADPKLRSRHQQTAVNFACQAQRENVRLLKLLVAAGTDIDAIDELYCMGALRQAAVKNHHRLVEELLLAGAPADGLAGETESPLCSAARRGAVDAVRVLIENGADVEFAGRNSDGGLREDASPLTACLLRHHHEVATLLIEAGADVNKSDSLGATPLLIALGCHDPWEYERSQPPKTNLPFIRLMLAKGADPDLPAPGSALERVRRTKNTRLIGLIKSFSK